MKKKPDDVCVLGDEGEFTTDNGHRTDTMIDQMNHAEYQQGLDDYF
jgi:hypothetical protein